MRIEKRAKKGVKKGPKRLKNGDFGPPFDHFSTFFQPMWILGSPLKSRAPCVEAWSSREKIRDGILRYEGSKSGILETCSATKRSKVWLASDQVCFTIPNLVLTTFLVIFGFAATRSVQTSKMVDFDPKYLKIQIPHFSEFFWLNQKCWMRGGQPTPPL